MFYSVSNSNYMSSILPSTINPEVSYAFPSVCARVRACVRAAQRMRPTRYKSQGGRSEQYKERFMTSQP